MEVCEVCGAFLIVGDAQSRVDDHLMGKQHMGYAKIKATVEELKVCCAIFHRYTKQCIYIYEYMKQNVLFSENSVWTSHYC